ncbi:MAG: energy transducer TonB [Ignavibacteriaceae bacterium]|nr:energy transducer TonB [Ignavibacteriaceae bacterium]
MESNLVINEKLNEIVFAFKNKEYGAYLLRQLYRKHISLSIWVVIFAFSLGTSTPIIIKYFTPKEDMAKKKLRVIDYTQLSEPPSIDKKEEKIDVEAPPPLKSTIKFLPPVVKPDEEVTDEYIPSQEELKEVDPGKLTQQGDPGGVDYSLLDIEEEKQPEVVKEEEKEAEIFTYVEEMPSFPGGPEEMFRFFSANIQYPEIAKRAGVEGKIFVSFVVTRGGVIRDVAVVKGIGAGCDEEAVRVVKTMPSWNPGKQNGNPVSVRVSIPIIFKLN